MQVNTSIPAKILEIPHSSFNKEMHNDYVTHCKLKIFFIGETGDKRLFTKEFSEKLLETLPQTPVVGFYDEEDEDFKGHNSKQFVYGYVPESSNVHFEEEDGVTWAFTDIVLFTGRDDNIGEVANKIIGRSHSLELDPENLDYEIKQDSKGNLKQIEFKEGKFIGLSVVGDSETPAFSGSSFFKDENFDEMASAYKDFAEKIDNFFTNSNEEKEIGGVNVEFLEQFSKNISPKIHEYLKNTYDELQQEVAEALYNVNEYAMPTQIGENFVVYFDYEEYEFYRMNYSRTESEEGEKGISFQDAVQVKARYLTEEEIDSLSKSSENNFEEDDEDDEDDDKDNESGEGAEKDEDEDDETNNMTGVGDNEGEPDTATLSESELEELKSYREKFEQAKAELESKEKQLDKYRNQEKLEMVEDYREFISKEEYEAFEKKHSDYTLEELDLALSVAVAKRVRNASSSKKESNITPTRFVKNSKNKKQKDEFNDFVDTFKDKNRGEY